jgi:hypothetical protein
MYKYSAGLEEVVLAYIYSVKQGFVILGEYNTT